MCKDVVVREYGRCVLSLSNFCAIYYVASQEAKFLTIFLFLPCGELMVPFAHVIIKSKSLFNLNKLQNLQKFLYTYFAVLDCTCLWISHDRVINVSIEKTSAGIQNKSNIQDLIPWKWEYWRVCLWNMVSLQLMFRLTWAWIVMFLFSNGLFHEKMIIKLNMLYRLRWPQFSTPLSKWIAFC